MCLLLSKQELNECVATVTNLNSRDNCSLSNIKLN